MGKCAAWERSPTVRSRSQAGEEAGRGGATACLLQAGPTGYVLYWQLAELGVECAVIAPTLAPRKAGDRVKTGRRAAGARQRLQQCGGRTALPAALLARPEPHRKSLGQAQSSAPCRQSLHRPGPRPSHRRSAVPDRHRKRRRMVQTPRRPYTKIGEMLSIRAISGYPTFCRGIQESRTANFLAATAPVSASKTAACCQLG